MKLCTIVGTRPQFVKAAAVSRILAQTPAIDERIIHTGQHYDVGMSDKFFAELSIPEPQFYLKIGSGSHARQTGQMLIAIEETLLAEKPDWVLVYGDTNSTLAGALAAAKLHIPVAHVEAGLRSFNRRMPEEINRITTDHISSLLFAPTRISHDRLLTEGLDANRVFNTGDVMLDATEFYRTFNADRETLVEKLRLEKKHYVLATIHRAENTDCAQRLENICAALLELSQTHRIVLPLHPRTRNALAENGRLATLEKHLQLIEPAGFLDMLALESQAAFIVTDSGGVQKEAYFNQVPCITLRNETEWVELTDSGWNQLCSPDQPFSLINYLNNSSRHDRQDNKLYGDGKAAQHIVKLLLSH